MLGFRAVSQQILKIFTQRTGVTPKNELYGRLAGFSQGTKALLLKMGLP
jgi:hypothetical protein